MSDKKGQRPSDDLIDWFTVSYRSIFLVVAAVLVLGALGGYAFYTRHAPSPEPTEAPAPAGGSTARFRTLEGSVKVKPVGTFEWVPADTSTVLRKSDLVRTGPGSAAEISFFESPGASTFTTSSFAVSTTSTRGNHSPRPMAPESLTSSWESCSKILPNSL